MFNRIDASKSTKGASKLRRDLINAEIANLRDLLPLPPSTRQRLSQLQLMALVCVFLRKANYFQQALKSDPSESSDVPTPNIGFSKAMSGFIMMMTQQGKLLYISENAAEYLGHSMEDLLIHGDSVYDVVDKQDHTVVESQLARNTLMPNERRLFLCRINVSRNSRRQLRFGDQKVVLVEGHYLPFVPLCNRSESVFLASCTPVVLPETRESVVQGATNIFTTIHSMDMKYLHIDKTAESHLEYARSELVGASWYNLVHWESIRTAYCKHQTVIQSDQERTSTALLRLQSRSGRWFWIHCVLQVKETSDECQQPIIVCTNQVLSDREAEVMRSSPWLYRYSAQSKFTYGLCPSSQQPAQQQNPPLTTDPYVSHLDYQQQQQQHQHHLSQNVQMPQQQQQQHCNDFRSESRPYPAAGNGGKVGRRTQDEIEPVDMSINSTADHESTKSLYHLTHSLGYGSNDHHHHHHHHQEHQQQLHEMRESVSPGLVNYHRPGKSTIIQYSRAATTTSATLTTTTTTTTTSASTTTATPTSKTTTRYSDDSPVHRYSIIDLDVAYSTCGESCGECCIESRMSVNPSAAAAAVSRRIVAKHHQQLGESNETSMEHHWNCSSPPVWSDALQRVPDVAHQDLSPYITTPTTPGDARVDTPDSAEMHSQVAVFNFEWSTAGDVQHVPVSKVIVGEGKPSDAAQQREKTLAAAAAPPMLTLHLPNKRKSHSDAPKD